MITDVIVGAIDTMIDLCDDPVQKNGMLSLREMLCDLDEAQWYTLNAEEEKAWLSQFLESQKPVHELLKQEQAEPAAQSGTAEGLIKAMVAYGMEHSWSDSEIVHALTELGVTYDDFCRAGARGFVKDYFEAPDEKKVLLTEQIQSAADRAAGLSSGLAAKEKEVHRDI